MKIKSFLFVTSFLPVITFKIIARTGDADIDRAKAAVVAGLVLAVIQFIISRRINKHTTYLEWAFLGFLTAGAMWVYALPEPITYLFVNNSTAILYFVLFLTTLVPQLAGYDPFTYAIAKLWQPEAVWKTREFRTINFHITYVFSGIMLLAFISNVIGHGRPFYAILVPSALILGVGLPFSRLYPKYYINKQYQKKPQDTTGLPGTAKELILKMPAKFNKEAGKDLQTQIQFKLSGEGGGDFVLSIDRGRCISQEGDISTPGLTIISTADVWMKIARGEINRAKALMDGLFKIEGDMDLLIKMGELFSGPEK